MYQVPYSINDLRYLTKEFLLKHYQRAVKTSKHDFVYVIMEEKLILLKKFIKEFDNSDNDLRYLYKTFKSFLPEESEMNIVLIQTPLNQVPLLINAYKGNREGFNELINLRLRIGK